MAETAFQLIAAERERQIAKGFDAAHDDKHEFGDLADAAAAYATIAGPIVRGATADEFDGYFVTQEESWPFEEEDWRPSDDPIRNLVKAGALIVAEIERLQRKAAQHG